MSLLTLPGLIDPHVHLRDPGQTEKEDFETGTKAALAGGYTTVLDMPNNKIPITTAKLLDEKMTIANDKIVCDVGFYFGSIGDNFSEFEKVVSKVFGLKLYLSETTGHHTLDKNLLEQACAAWQKAQSLLLRSNRLQSPVLIHAEDDTIEDVIGLVEKTNMQTHIVHITTQKGLEQIIDAKNRNLPITCGVTPHHLFLTKSDAQTLGPLGMVKPPLAKQSDVDFLWRNLSAIDVIESDHAPHTKEEKEAGSAYGFAGLETTLPLLLTAVFDQKLTIEDIKRLCFENPKKIFHIPVDQDSYVEIDSESEYTIQSENFFTKSKWSPYNGWRVKGKVVRVFLRGEKVFEDENILAKAGSGRVIFPMS